MVGLSNARMGLCARVASITMAALVLAGAIGVVLPAAPASAAPEPAAIPTRWEFTLDPGPLRVMTVDIGNGPQAYYYLTYKVTNHSGEDRFFTPTFEIYTDDGTLMRSGRDVPQEVTDYILRRLGNALLLDEIGIQDTLLQGRENAREGLVVWPVRETDIDEIKIFANGFSGETKTIERPDNGKPITLRKTMMLVHRVPGHVNTNTSRPIPRLENASRWIMR